MNEEISRPASSSNANSDEGGIMRGRCSGSVVWGTAGERAPAASAVVSLQRQKDKKKSLPLTPAEACVGFFLNLSIHSYNPFICALYKTLFPLPLSMRPQGGPDSAHLGSLLREPCRGAFRGAYALGFLTQGKIRVFWCARML